MVVEAVAGDARAAGAATLPSCALVDDVFAQRPGAAWQLDRLQVYTYGGDEDEGEAAEHAHKVDVILPRGTGTRAFCQGHMARVRILPIHHSAAGRQPEASRSRGEGTSIAPRRCTPSDLRLDPGLALAWLANYHPCKAYCRPYRWSLGTAQLTKFAPNPHLPELTRASSLTADQETLEYSLQSKLNPERQAPSRRRAPSYPRRAPSAATQMRVCSL